MVTMAMTMTMTKEIFIFTINMIDTGGSGICYTCGSINQQFKSEFLQEDNKFASGWINTTIANICITRTNNINHRAYLLLALKVLQISKEQICLGIWWSVETGEYNRPSLW